jgi:hypothetical protein
MATMIRPSDLLNVQLPKIQVPPTNASLLSQSVAAASQAPRQDAVEISHEAQEAAQALLRDPGNDRQATVALLKHVFSQQVIDPGRKPAAAVVASHATTGLADVGGTLDMRG